MKDTPDPPDYAAAAEEQSRSSREVTEQQTWANRPDQFTPFGSTTWSNTPTRDPATGQILNRWRQDTTLNPEAQAALDAQMGVTRERSELARDLTGRLRSDFGDEVDFSSFTDWADIPEANDATRQRAEDALYGRMTSRLDPRFQQEEGDLRTRLYNQGLREGDAAFQREVDNFGRNKTDAYQTAMNESIMGGGREMSNLFGMEMDAAGFQNTTRAGQIAEELQQRGYSLNEINAMLTGQQVGMPGMPNFMGAERAEGTQNLQAAGMQHSANMDQFNAEQAQLQGLMSGAGSMFAFSDRRLKENIKHIGYDMHGNNLYRYNYIGEEPSVVHIGVMADEVNPAFVTEKDGYKMVDYGALYGRA